MANEVEASVRGEGPLVAIDVAGEVTAFAEDALTRAYRAAIDRAAKYVLFDFRRATYINSAGISVLIGILTDSQQHDRRILFTGLTPHYRKIFDLMGLSRYAGIFDTEDQARQAIAERS
ncbi:MAG: STAS domain-containing protein [Chloroflexi bacterium]|nr:STAS domain-containing protein [Chloroflexota bacterium]